MSNYTLTYDPKKVTITIGTQTVFGFSEGSLVQIDKADNVTSTTRGVDGRDLTINFNPMRDGTATISLQHTSPFNKVLYAWWESSQLGLDVILPFQVSDDASIQLNTVCWLEQIPSLSLGQETGELQWVVHLRDAVPKSNAAYSMAVGLGDVIGVKLPSL